MYQETFEFDPTVKAGDHIRISPRETPVQDIDMVFKVKYKPSFWEGKRNLTLTYSGKARRNADYVFPDWLEFCKSGGLQEAFGSWLPFSSDDLIKRAALRRLCAPGNPRYQIHYGATVADSTGCMLVGCSKAAMEVLSRTWNAYNNMGFRLRSNMIEYSAVHNRDIQTTDFMRGTTLMKENGIYVPTSFKGNIEGRAPSWAFRSLAVDLYVTAVTESLKQLASVDRERIRELVGDAINVA